MTGSSEAHNYTLGSTLPTGPCTHRVGARRPASLQEQPCDVWPDASQSDHCRRRSPAIMADDIVIDKALFQDRLSAFVAKWKADKRSGDHIFQGAAAIATVVGKASEPGTYLKPAAFQLWLLGYEFPATLFILTPDLLQVVTTKKKGKPSLCLQQVVFPPCTDRGLSASYLEPLKGGKVPVEILVRGKDPDENRKQFQTCIDTLRSAGDKVAVLKKDSATGAFADEWKAAFAEADFGEQQQVDLAPIMSAAALSVKDEKELVSPGLASCHLYLLQFHCFPGSLHDVHLTADPGSAPSAMPRVHRAHS